MMGSWNLFDGKNHAEFTNYTTTPEGKHFKYMLLPKMTPRCFYIMKTLRNLFYSNNSQLVEKGMEALCREHGIDPETIAIPVFKPKYATLQRLRNVKPKPSKTAPEASQTHQPIAYDPL